MIATFKCWNNFHIFTFSNFHIVKKFLYLHPHSRTTNRVRGCNQAGIAQLVEHDLAKVGVASSSLVSRSTKTFMKIGHPSCGNSSVGRARPCQGRGREFESRFPLNRMPRWWNGRHVGLKIQWPLWPCGFKSRPGYNIDPIS
jgi:hypothetical protein